MLAAIVLFCTAIAPTLAQETGTPGAGELSPTAVPTIEEQTPTPAPAPATTEPAVVTETEMPVETPADPEPAEEPSTEPVGDSAESPEQPPANPEETAEPAPEATLHVALSEQPDCSLLPDQPGTIASGGTLDYECASRLRLDGERITPVGVRVAWEIQASTGDGWNVRLLPPTDDPEAPAGWTEFRNGETGFAFDQREPVGPGAEATDIDQEISITYRLRVERPACALTPQDVRVTHTATVAHEALERSVEPEPDPESGNEALRLSPALAPVPEPSVTFAGPLDFGDIGATAAGLVESSRSGSIDVVVTGLDQACGDWTLVLSATPLVDPADEPLDGSQLLLSAVDGTTPTDDGCALIDGCAALTLTGNPDAPASRTITLTITLQMPPQASLGAFSTTLDAALIAAGVDDSSGSPGA